MPFSFIAEPLRTAVSEAVKLNNGKAYVENETLIIEGKHELLRSLTAISSTLHHEAQRAGMTIRLLDSDAELTVAGVFGKNGTAFGSASRA